MWAAPAEPHDLGWYRRSIEGVGMTPRKRKHANYIFGSKSFCGNLILHKKPTKYLRIYRTLQRDAVGLTSLQREAFGGMDRELERHCVSTKIGERA
jgi:hypothetical protein